MIANGALRILVVGKKGDTCEYEKNCKNS